MVTKKERIGQEKKQHGLFKKRRGGVVLTKDEVREIKKGRKRLRRQMKQAGIRSRKEFELTASGLGLYFDKTRYFGLLLWLLHGRALWTLFGSLLALLGVLFLLSLVSQMRGHFTINMSDGMFAKGFSLSETADFALSGSRLYADPAVEAPCISIADIPDDIDKTDGSHNGKSYFAYTFYLRNEGEEPVSYIWRLGINSESQNLSSAAWVMLFEDGEMRFFAEPTAAGKPETIPPANDNSRGYREAPLIQMAKQPDRQYEVVASTGAFTYYRVVPLIFESAETVVSGTREDAAPMQPHKYTVVIWLEGDDPDCTDTLIGGHLGLEMDFELLEESDSEAAAQNGWNKAGKLIEQIRDAWNGVLQNLRFWGA